MGDEKVGSDLQDALSRRDRSHDAGDSKACDGTVSQKLELSIGAKRQLVKRLARRTVDERDTWKVDNAAHARLFDATDDFSS